MKKYLLLLITLSISSCSLLAPVPAPDTGAYTLSEQPEIISRAESSRGILFLMPVNAPATISTTKMAYMRQPFKIEYFTRHAWVDSPNQLIDALLLSTIQKTQDFKAVVTPANASNYDYALNVRMIKFQQNFISSPAQMETSIEVQFKNIKNSKLIASKIFTVNIPMSKKTPYAGVIAANIAIRLQQQKLINFYRHQLNIMH